jgi:hypothetical protein
VTRHADAALRLVAVDHVQQLVVVQQVGGLGPQRAVALDDGVVALVVGDGHRGVELVRDVAQRLVARALQLLRRRLQRRDLRVQIDLARLLRVRALLRLQCGGQGGAQDRS